MAEKTLVSGRLKIKISFIDRKNEYKVKICPTVKGERCETVFVGPPASGSRSTHGKRLSVDDPRAFKQAASSAIAFASNDIQEHADHNRRGSGFLVRPPRRTRRK